MRLRLVFKTFSFRAPWAGMERETAMTFRFEEVFTRRHLVTAVASAALLASPALRAQETQPADIHGHVQNAIGQTMTTGQVKFSKDLSKKFEDESFTNTVEVNKEGTYDAKGITPGEYYIWFVQGGKTVDRQQVTIKSGENRTVDFDMTRPEYLNGLTPEQRKQIEEFKAKNSAAVSGNKVIANLNSTLTEVRADLKTPSPNFDKDLADMKQAVDARPTEPLLYAVQGEVYAAQAKKLAAADRTNKTSPMQDDATKAAYSNGATALQKAVDLMASGSKPNPEQQATVLNQLGNLYAEEGKIDDANTAYEKAATLMPANAGMYYSNQAAELYNAHQDQAALAAAEKAIAKNPDSPNPYYIKGQELLNKATVDAKGKIIPPPGCMEAYQKYLELAPDGAQAPAVKDVLTQMGQKIETKYRAPGKKR